MSDASHQRIKEAQALCLLSSRFALEPNARVHNLWGTSPSSRTPVKSVAEACTAHVPRSSELPDRCQIFFFFVPAGLQTD